MTTSHKFVSHRLSLPMQCTVLAKSGLNDRNIVEVQIIIFVKRTEKEIFIKLVSCSVLEECVDSDEYTGNIHLSHVIFCTYSADCELVVHR